MHFAHKISSFILVSILLFIGCQSFKTTLRCGEWFKATTGGIYHKPFEQVLNNERCLWIIWVPGANTYNITLQYLGGPTNEENQDQELLLMGVNHTSDGRVAISPQFTHLKPDTLATYTISDVNLVVVIFASGLQTPETSTGFVLSYESFTNGFAPVIHTDSSHHFLESPLLEFHFPNRTGKYNAMELTTFVFPPHNNLYSGTPNHIYYKYHELQDGCYDGVDVLKFNKSSTDLATKWIIEDRLCKGLANLHIHHDDIILLIFQSSPPAYEYQGFWLWYVGCC